MVAVNDKLIEVSARLQLDFRVPDAVTIRAIHDKLRVKNETVTVVAPIIEITREIDQVSLRGVAREEHAARSVLRFPF